MMLRMRAALVLAGLALTAGVADAHAQALGIPVNNSGVPTGIAFYGDVSFPNATAGKGTAFGLTGKAGFGRIGATAMVSRYNPGGDVPNADDGITSVGATLNYRLLGGPLIPLSATLQAGAGYWKQLFVVNGGVATDRRTVWHVPVGLGIAYSIPGPAFSLRPWVAPRLDVLHTGVGADSPVGATSETATSFAVSAGVELNLLSGLGLQAAYDWSGEDGHPQMIAVGAHYALRVPGL